MSSDIDVLLHFQPIEGTDDDGEEEEETSVNGELERSNQSAGGAVVKRRKTNIKPISKACNECARRKARCPGGQPCGSCLKSGATCEYSPAQRRGPKAKKRNEEGARSSSTSTSIDGHTRGNQQQQQQQEQHTQTGEERGLNLLAELSRASGTTVNNINVGNGIAGSCTATNNHPNGRATSDKSGHTSSRQQQQQQQKILARTSSSSNNNSTGVISPSQVSLLSLPPVHLNSVSHPNPSNYYSQEQSTSNKTTEPNTSHGILDLSHASGSGGTSNTFTTGTLFPESSDGHLVQQQQQHSHGIPLHPSQSTVNVGGGGGGEGMNGQSSNATATATANANVTAMHDYTTASVSASGQYGHYAHQSNLRGTGGAPLQPSTTSISTSQVFNLPAFNFNPSNPHHPFADAESSLSTMNNTGHHSQQQQHQHQQQSSSSAAALTLPLPALPGLGSLPLPLPATTHTSPPAAGGAGSRSGAAAAARSSPATAEDSSAAFAQTFYKAEGPGLGHFQNVLSREFNVREGDSPAGNTGSTHGTGGTHGHGHTHHHQHNHHNHGQYVALHHHGSGSSAMPGNGESDFLHSASGMGYGGGPVNAGSSSISDVGFSPAGSDVPLPPHMEKDLVALADLLSTQQTLFGIYWCFVHVQWPIVYRPTFGFDQAKEIPPLYNAMLAIICRPDVSRQLQHVPGTLKKLPLAGRLGEIYTKRAIAHLNMAEMVSSLHKVQALFMLSLFDIGQGNTSRGWMFCGMATRMAFDLQLHQPSKTYKHGPATPIVHQEQRRTIWCCYALDISMSIFLGRPSMMRFSDIETPLPSHWEADEFSYWAEDAKAVIPDRLTAFVGVQARPISTFVAYVKLCYILERTMESVYKLKGGPARAPSSAAEELNNALDAWVEEHAELFKRAENPGQCTTNIYHVLLWYHATRLILNRPFIPNNQLINTSKGEKSAYTFCTEAADEIVALVCSLEDTHGVFRVSYNVMFTIFQAGVMHCLISSTARDPLVTNKANESFKQCDGWLDSMTRSYKCTAQYRHVLVAMERLSRRELRDSMQVTEILASRRGSRQPTPAYSDPSGENGLLPGDYNENPLSMLHYSFWDMPLHFPLQNNEMDSWMSWEQDYGSLLLEGMPS